MAGQTSCAQARFLLDPCFRRTLPAVLATIACVLLQSPASARTTPEIRCQQTLAKAARRYGKDVYKIENACGDTEAAGVPCSGQERTAREAQAAARLERSIGRRCSAAELSRIGFPAQCLDDDGPPFSAADVAACMRVTHSARVRVMHDHTYPGAPAALRGERFACQHRIGKSARKLADAMLRARQACLNRGLKGKLAANADCYDRSSPSATHDRPTDRRLERAPASFLRGIAGACASVALEDLGFPGNCADPDGPPFTREDLVDCLADVHDALVVALAGIEYAAGSTPGSTTTTLGTPTTTTTLGGSTTTVPASTTTLPTTTTTLPSLDEIRDRVSPDGDTDGDGFSNATELAACSNPADPASTPENDNSLCLNQTIFSDTLGPAWGNTNNMSEPSYNAATTALVAQNTADCGAYCATTPNIGSPQACVGAWPWSGVPEHGRYNEGETVEVTFPDEDGNMLHGTIFLPPDVGCEPDFVPTCDGVTDAVTCTAPNGQTYPAVVICDGFTGTQRMYYWAAHRLARDGYIAMTFDVSGQGRSQGQFPNGDSGIAADLGNGDGFSRDIGAAMNFIVSTANPVRDLIAVDPLLIVNQATGATSHTEPYVLGLAGHSAGATASIAYQQSTETARYPVRARAVVGWSHFDRNGTIGNVPIQMHSGDEDSGFIQPPGSGTTAPQQERRFDRLGGDRDLDGTPDFAPHDRQIIMTEDGTHLSYSQGSWFYYPTWSEELQYHYTLAWFDKYLKNDLARTMSSVTGNVIESVDPFQDYKPCAGGASCFSATERLKMVHPHLSNVWCSRYDIEGDFNGDMKGGGCRTQ